VAAEDKKAAPCFPPMGFHTTRNAPADRGPRGHTMNRVVITHKKTGKVVAQVRIQVSGMNYTPSAAEWHADAWRVAIDDRLIPADADKNDYDLEIVPVSIRGVFSGRS
jgi:hypothetical protein